MIFLTTNQQSPSINTYLHILCGILQHFFHIFFRNGYTSQGIFMPAGAMKKDRRSFVVDILRVIVDIDGIVILRAESNQMFAIYTFSFSGIHQSVIVFLPKRPIKVFIYPDISESRPGILFSSKYNSSGLLLLII